MNKSHRVEKNTKFFFYLFGNKTVNRKETETEEKDSIKKRSCFKKSLIDLSVNVNP